jgi:membrane-anchored protein YejM (alkaline phosphatase superfamily)
MKWISGEEFSALAKQTATIVAALHFLGAYIIHVSVVRFSVGLLLLLDFILCSRSLRSVLDPP